MPVLLQSQRGEKNTADGWRAQRGHHFSHSVATFLLATLSISTLLSGLFSSSLRTSLCKDVSDIMATLTPVCDFHLLFTHVRTVA